MAQVAFRGATKRFGGVTAVDHLDLTVADGELLVLLGPSGCGKTTALRMVAGLEGVDAGEILIGGQVVNDVEPRDRDVAMVFQSYALYPHLTAARNIEFPLRQRGIGRDERHRRVAETAASLGLTELLDRKPGQLSGGQRQRVALARAIVRIPQVFLMDEPLSNLDATLRLQTRADIATLQRRLGTTTVYVTHDQVEAMTMGHRIAVMRRGIIQQVDRPDVLYDHPANTFVAGFLGAPGMNLIPARAEPRRAPGGTGAGGTGGTAATGPELVLRVAGGEIGLDGRRVACATSAGPLVAGVRAEHLAIDPGGTVDAKVVIVELLGAEVHVACRLADGTAVVVRQDTGRARPASGDAVRLSVPPEVVHLFAAETGTRLLGAP